MYRSFDTERCRCSQGGSRVGTEIETMRYERFRSQIRKGRLPRWQVLASTPPMMTHPRPTLPLERALSLQSSQSEARASKLRLGYYQAPRPKILLAPGTRDPAQGLLGRSGLQPLVRTGPRADCQPGAHITSRCASTGGAACAYRNNIFLFQRNPPVRVKLR